MFINRLAKKLSFLGLGCEFAGSAGGLSANMLTFFSELLSVMTNPGDVFVVWSSSDF
jgi:hypothetical protein